MLCTFGFTDDVIFSIMDRMNHVNNMSATPLQHRAQQTDAPAAWCWLRPVLDKARRQNCRRVRYARGAGRQSAIDC